MDTACSPHWWILNDILVAAARVSLDDAVYIFWWFYLPWRREDELEQMSWNRDISSSLKRWMEFLYQGSMLTWLSYVR